MLVYIIYNKPIKEKIKNLREWFHQSKKLGQKTLKINKHFKERDDNQQSSQYFLSEWFSWDSLIKLEILEALLKNSES